MEKLSNTTKLTNDVKLLNLNETSNTAHSNTNDTTNNSLNTTNINSSIPLEDQSKEVRVAMIGNVDSGKSTLVGVLTKCTLDDGRGYLRSLISNYSHEKELGKTSSIAHEIMGFDENGNQIAPERVNEKKNTAWSQVTKKSSKIISLIDLCGHEQYLKTTMFGLSGLLPDYAMIVVGANMGIQRMTKEHLGIALSLKIPIIIVVTKIDLAPKEIKDKTLEDLKKILQHTTVKRNPILVDDETKFEDNNIGILNNIDCPIFFVSSTKGDGISKLRYFMSLLTSRASDIKKRFACEDNGNKVEFLIDSVFSVKGIGLVTSGILVSGIVTSGQTLMIGPNSKGEFRSIIVKSIHFKRNVVSSIEEGNSCCFNIKSGDPKSNIKKENIRKGMVLLDKNLDKKTARIFEAEVVILHHATTIKPKYQAVIHVGVIRQTAQVLEIKDKELLRTGDRGMVLFKFINSPEYIHIGSHILFREGRTRGFGIVTKIIS